jgi:pyruvate/2-oxoglutarate/acetoin dehydrogenase E1 component
LLEGATLSREIIDPIERTGKSTLVVAEEGPRRGGFGAELAASAAEEWFDYLDAPVERLGATSTPLPYSPVLEAACIPGEDDIIRAARRAMGREG